MLVYLGNFKKVYGQPITPPRNQQKPIQDNARLKRSTVCFIPYSKASAISP